MRAWKIQSAGDPNSALRLVDDPDAAPGPGQIRVRLRASSLNFRDLIVLGGHYPGVEFPRVPLSDGAGEVAAVGPGVARWKVGDKVMPLLAQNWVRGAIVPDAGLNGLGGDVDGVLRDSITLPEAGVVAIPETLSFAEAATLPCAALTAWNALSQAGTKAGDTVLLQGTGGVSIFALQFAKAMGATVIHTTSSADKEARLRDLGADHTVNYTETPQVDQAVLSLTGGRGADHVIDIGGAGTLDKSMGATAVGGTVSLIGVLDMAGAPAMVTAIAKSLTLRGLFVGSGEMFEAMNRAIAVNGIKPVIGKTFGFAEAPAAYGYFGGRQHFGKVVIEQ